MKRFSLILIICLQMIAGCSAAKQASAADPNPTVSAKGAFDETPKVTIPDTEASESLVIRTLIAGNGSVITTADSFAVNYVSYIWSGTRSKVAINSFTSFPRLLTGNLLPGLREALIGKRVGSRILAVVPPAYGYGSAGDPPAGITGSDTLVYVIDLLTEKPDNAAASGRQISAGGGMLPIATPSNSSSKGSSITIPSGRPPRTLITRTLIRGTGQKIGPQQYVICQYTGVVWRTGKIFSSSWQLDRPLGFAMDAVPEQVLPGWDQGLAGQTVGSRVLLVVPPADGYGSQGATGDGITGTDTLVFVVDIVDAIGLHQTS